MRYAVLRSVSDNKVQLIIRDEGFEAVPQQIRALGPWQKTRSGEAERMKTHYRLMLAEQSFVFVYASVAVFMVES
jgi:hypothetical protein